MNEHRLLPTPYSLLPTLTPVLLGLAVVSAVLLPLNLLAGQPLHHDEALYATWAVEIASGNPLLAHTPVDKPPLFLYTMAGFIKLLGISPTIARLPSLLAAGVTVGLTFVLGRRVYGTGVGLAAAWLVALSPFTILFASTAFTDPMLAALVWAACLAAAGGRPGWAGLGMGLAVATKQQGVFFLPLVGGLLVLPRMWGKGKVYSMRPALKKLGRFLLTILLALLPVLAWDLARQQWPGFWQQSLLNYGGLATDAASFSQRWNGLVQLLRYGTASPVLNIIFLGGLPVLLGYETWFASRTGEDQAGQANLTDWLLVLFILAFLAGHALFSFQVWDRYLLGLIPGLALLLARILLLPWRVLRRYRLDHQPHRKQLAAWGYGLAVSLLLVITLSGPVQDAVLGRYPLGSHSQALVGIEQIAAYLRGQVGANTTLYHRWLGTHWRFYLRGFPYDLKYWSFTEELAAQAQAGHLIAFPTWQSETEARLALAQAGWRLQELSRAYGTAGYPSIILYRIERDEQ